MALRDEQFLVMEPDTSLCDAGFHVRATQMLIVKIHGHSYMISLVQDYIHSKQYKCDFILKREVS
jgi:hypothetical protein